MINDSWVEMKRDARGRSSYSRIEENSKSHPALSPLPHFDGAAALLPGPIGPMKRDHT